MGRFLVYCSSPANTDSASVVVLGHHPKSYETRIYSVLIIVIVAKLI
jgi:hypothetical protein